MEQTKINLLKGCYTPEQAQELIAGIINSNLQFHNLRNFKSLISHSGPCSQANDNITSLVQARNTLNGIIADADQHTDHFVVEAVLRITRVPAPVEAPAEAAFA